MPQSPKPSSTNDLSIDGGSPGNVNLIYILYLVSVVIGVTSIVGVIMAYLGRADADPVLRSHYDNQIGIFWKAVLYFVIGGVLTLVLIGVLVILVALVWFVVRSVLGMQALSKGQAIANPGSWTFTTD